MHRRWCIRGRWQSTSFCISLFPHKTSSSHIKFILYTLPQVYHSQILSVNYQRVQFNPFSHNFWCFKILVKLELSPSLTILQQEHHIREQVSLFTQTTNPPATWQGDTTCLRQVLILVSAKSTLIEPQTLFSRQGVFPQCGAKHTLGIRNY